jgi:hypothetical protein
MEGPPVALIVFPFAKTGNNPMDSIYSTKVIPFPARGPFIVRVEREGVAWLVICRDHGWLFGDRDAANAEAVSVASGFGVSARTAR